MKIGSILGLVVAGVFVMIFAYEVVFLLAPTQRSFADCNDDFADTWEEMATTAEELNHNEWAQEYREHARADRDEARANRDWARETTIAGYLFGAVGITLTGRGTYTLVRYRQSRRNETKI